MQMVSERTTVGEFFDKQADDYHVRHGRVRPFDRITAQRIQTGVSGRVLCIGGLWSQANVADLDCEIVVVDLSEAMLEHYRPMGVELVVGDARELEFADESFNHVVMPLVLHHITDNSGLKARAGVRAALSEAYRVLTPGGRIWIPEFCVSSGVYGIELAASPATRLLLSLAKVPLVVMHSTPFFRRALGENGFADVQAERIQPPEARPTDLLTPIIGIPWIRVPRFLYPVTPTLVTACKRDAPT